jgi:hypothetical protein
MMPWREEFMHFLNYTNLSGAREKKLEAVRARAVAVSVDHPPAWRDTSPARIFFKIWK